MAFDPRWKNPQGKTPDQLHRWAQDTTGELRKGGYQSLLEAAIAAAQADIDAVEAEVDALQAAVGTIANEDFQFLFAMVMGEDQGSL